MKILYWTDFFLPNIGGIETFSADLIPALQERGHDVTVLTSLHDDSLPCEEKVGSIPVHRFPIWESLRTNDLKAVFSVRKAVSEFKKRLDPDIVHLHFGASSFYHLQTLSTVQTPTLTTVHALPERSLLKDSLFTKVVHASQAVNAVSRKGLQILTDAFPERADRFSFVYYGLGPSENESITIVDPSFDQPCLLCLGRLTPQKGFDVALRAFAQVLPSSPKARLMIVGGGVEENPLKALAASLGISASVDFNGPVPPQDVLKVMNRATMVLLPSRFEGLPLVSLQAARMQRPMISSNVDGLPDLIVNQESGIVLRENNERELAGAILSLLREPEKATAMGKAAAKRLEDMFGFDQCVARYEALYRQTLRQNPSAITRR